MHELATTKNIVSICENEAKKQGFSKVTEIHLKIGVLSGILPEYITEFFPYVSPNTVCEGARLICEPIPAAVRCPDCGYEGPADGWDCPDCGGSSIQITAGREFFVDSISVE